MTKGRPREFNTTEALEKAMVVFWKKGYRGTSLDDLTEAMQINRPSLYAAFGDKENLFLQAIDHYRERMIVPNVKKLLAAEDVRQGLSEFFKSMISVIMENDTPPGCMVACLLSEDCCDSEAIKNKLSDSISGADAAFCRLFELHRKEMKKSIDPTDAGRMMTTLVHGIAIRARSGATKRTLYDVGESFVSMVLRSE